ncbi:hypothetical protein BDR26DRAFT_922582 [Obelidium mucronatum]|nr:hypothetical protein BDR26DRAFT_922582 [Obelidium mucronatum]
MLVKMAALSLLLAASLVVAQLPNQAIVFGSETPSGAAAIAGLKAYSVPYVAYTVAASVGFQTLPLKQGNAANFSMIVLGGSGAALAFTPAQLNQLYDYQTQNNVRLVTLYDTPGSGASAGITNTTAGAAIQGNFSVTPANIIGSTSAGLPSSYSIALDTNKLGWVYPGQVLNSSVATPVLSIGTGAAAVVYNFPQPQARQQLSFFYQIAEWDAVAPGDTISEFSNEIWISWASKGKYGFVAPPTAAQGSVVNQTIIFGSETPSGKAVILALQSYKVPYVAFDTASSIKFATLPFYAGTTANFSMIVVGHGVSPLAFRSVQWSQIYAYQRATGARLVSLYDQPGAGLSAGFTSGGAVKGNYTVAPSNAIATTAAGLPAKYSIPFSTDSFDSVYLAAIRNSTAVTPILSFSDSAASTSIAACLYNFSNVQQQLSFFYQITDWDYVNPVGITRYTTEILISWMSKGLFGYQPPAPVVTHPAQVLTRALILATDDDHEEYPQMTLQSYGLAYDTLIFTNTTMSNSPLNLEVIPNQLGRYSVIILSTGQMGVQFANGTFLSTLYPWQWKQIYNYQQFYGVRLVAINDIPRASIFAGKLAAVNNAVGCNSATTLQITPSSSNFTEPAGLKSNWTLTAGDGIAGGSCNFPATIVDSASVDPVLNFVSNRVNSGVAAAVIDFGRNQEQMSFFLPCGSWSIACTTIGNIWFQWVTRGAYTGLRRVYFTPQIDDVFLSTPGNDENGKYVNYRISPDDVQGLMDWMPDLNRRLPRGSNLTIEMAYNGNGVMEVFSKTDLKYYVDFDPDLTDAPLDWKKPLKTGKTIWPALSTLETNWNASVLAGDRLYNFFSAPGNLTSVSSKFLWVSHTFTHEILNNNSYSDTMNDIKFNWQLASKKYWGLDGQPYWSNKSLVTPGISGIFNGDALQALTDFGLIACVGDSSRNKTLNSVRKMWWPYTTTVADSNFAGFTVIPRQSVTIYFNTTNTAYNTILYNNIYGTNHSFSYLMGMEVSRNMRTLALLSWEPAMFHQANLRNADLPIVTMGSKTGKLGLMQQWVEAIFGNFSLVSNWPIVTLKQDDLTQKFIDRQNYETANVSVIQLLNVTASDGVSILGFNITASKDCVAPVTLPPSFGAENVSLPAGAYFEQIGIDSVTMWIPLRANAPAITVNYGFFPKATTTTATVSTASTSISSTVSSVTPVASALPRCYSAWSPLRIYFFGDTVSRNGANYRSKWWNLGDAPGGLIGDIWGVWALEGSCTVGGTGVTTNTAYSPTSTTTRTTTTTAAPLLGQRCNSFPETRCVNRVMYYCTGFQWAFWYNGC